MNKLFDTNLKIAIIIISLIGTLAGGMWKFDERYARASDVEQQIGELKNIYLQSELRALKKERFEFEITKEKRHLTTLEQGRLKIVQEEIKRLEKQIK